MSDLRELYQELIIDHNRRPRNFYVMEDATQHMNGFNPLCGDKMTVYLKVKNNTVEKASFQGTGCAISMASASLMTESLIGKTVEEAETIFQTFHTLMTGACDTSSHNHLGKLNVLSGVRDYPARVKCATLAWHAMHAALSNEHPDSVTTESLNE